jgi:hypothetical protein
LGFAEELKAELVACAEAYLELLAVVYGYE